MSNRVLQAANSEQNIWSPEQVDEGLASGTLIEDRSLFDFFNSSVVCPTAR